MALDKKAEIFIVYITCLTSKILIYLTQKAQIAWLIAKDVIVLTEYLDFLDIFLEKLVVELSKRSDINEYTINLKLDK